MPRLSNTTCSRRGIAPLIIELHEACRRPLFTEIGLDDAARNSAYQRELQSKLPDLLLQGGSSHSDDDHHHHHHHGSGSSGNGSMDEKVKAKEAKPLVVAEVVSSSSSSPAVKKEKKEVIRSQDRSNEIKRSWRELLSSASTMLPYMTEKEHDSVTHMAAVLLLGFLLPHSTGNEFFLLQHTPDNNSSSNNSNNNNSKSQTQTDAPINSNELAVDYILHMELEERLESTCRHYSAFEFGEFDTLTDLTWELAFHTFLKDGLAPFLGGRPASLQQVDLLHILAMVIHPQPSTTMIPETAAAMEDQNQQQQQPNPYWQRARNLMTNRHAHSFHVNYEHRLKIIKLVAHELVLPAYDPEAPMVHCPLFDGALAHLRASLHTFGMGAVSLEDAHWARTALVSIAVQSRIELVLKEEWEFLVNRMVDDRTLYPGCKCCPQMLREQPFGRFDKRTDRNGDDSAFCPHASRGLHLAEFLIRVCQSRHSTEGGSFLLEAFSSLTDAVEWQMHCWKKPDEDDEEEETSDVSEEPPCMLASLLFAAKTFFYFLLPMEAKANTSDDDEGDPDDMATKREELVSCSIQLIHHVDDTIASTAAELLALALAYGPKESINGYAKALFSSLELKLFTVGDNPKPSTVSSLRILQSSIQNVVSVTSRLSPAFAVSMLNLLFENLEKASSDSSISAEQEQFLLRVLSSACISSPGVAEGQKSSIIDLLGKLTIKASQSQGITALLACRQAHFFERKESEVDATVLHATLQIDDRWDLYKIARLALKTGNYAAASQCYQRILQASLNEKYFLWITALSKIAESELCLSKYAAKAIPQSTTTLRSALSIFQSMGSLFRSHDSDFSFQITIVSLRLDFLDLLTGLRQIIREMRLTGAGPAKRTRSHLHFQNIVRCFDALANRYAAIYRKYGLFLCQQSRTTLRSLHALCRFVARSVRVVFSDMQQSTQQKKEEEWPGSGPAGDSNLPSTRFLQCLDDRLLQKMSPSSMNPVIRAAAMLEVVDGVLLCPSPFPVDFLTVSKLPLVPVQLFADPEQTPYDDPDGDTDDYRDDLTIVEGYPGISFDFCATGEIPTTFLAKSKVPFASVVLWHRAEYAGPIQEDEHLLPDEKQEDEHMADEKQEDETAVLPKAWTFQRLSTNMLTNGKFTFRVECPPIREEGNYTIEIKLGCRDIRGGEWEIQVKDESRKMRVQVSRSNG